MPDKDVVFVQHPFFRSGARGFLFWNASVHQRRHLFQLFVLQLLFDVAVDFDQSRLRFGQDRSSFVDGCLRRDTVVGHAAAGVGDGGHAKISQQRARWIINFRPFLFGDLLRGLLFAGDGCFLVGCGCHFVCLGAFVDFDAAGVWQTGAASRHGADQIAVFAAASL